jgi:hypothetical protein
MTVWVERKRLEHEGRHKDTKFSTQCQKMSKNQGLYRMLCPWGIFPWRCRPRWGRRRRWWPRISRRGWKLWLKTMAASFRQSFDTFLCMNMYIGRTQIGIQNDLKRIQFGVEKCLKILSGLYLLLVGVFKKHNHLCKWSTSKNTSVQDSNKRIRCWWLRRQRTYSCLGLFPAWWPDEIVKKIVT